MDTLALILTVIGGINWGLVGIFRFDLVAGLCGGNNTILARIIYVVIAAASLWCISFMFREDSITRRDSETKHEH